MSGNVGTSPNTVVYAKGTSLWQRLCIPRFRTIAYVVDKPICRRYILLQGLCVSGVKTTIHACNRLKIDFFFQISMQSFETNQPNLGGLSRGSFLPPCFKETTSLKTILSFELAYICCILYKRVLWPISVSTKKFDQEKKSLFKSISKSIHVDPS